MGVTALSGKVGDRRSTSGVVDLPLNDKWTGASVLGERATNGDRVAVHM